MNHKRTKTIKVHPEKLSLFRYKASPYAASKKAKSRQANSLNHPWNCQARAEYLGK